MALRPCRMCHHDHTDHVYDRGEWSCIGSNFACDCHKFIGTKRQAAGFIAQDKAIILSHEERVILLHLLRKSEFAGDMLDLQEKLK